MDKSKKPYLAPVAILRRLRHPSIFCAGSGTPKFLDNDGLSGKMGFYEQDGDASKAASRRFDDEEVDEE